MGPQARLGWNAELDTFLPMIRLFLAALLALPCVFAAAATRESTGTTPGGAAFKINVPDGWQPGGPLVIVNHGYNFEVDDSPGLSVLAPLLLSQGYAVAASGYRTRGWAVFTALDDNAELLTRFTTEFGSPGKTIAVGGSMGGAITLKMLDDPRFKLDGAYALCAPADVYGAWDSAFDLRLAYDAVCGEVTGGKLPKGDEPYPWALNLDDLPSNLSDLENAPAVLQTLLPVTICTGLGFNQSVRLDAQKDRLAALMRYAQVDDEDFFVQQLGYAIYGLADVVRSPDKLNGRSPFDSRYVGGYAGSTAEIDARIPVYAPDLFARQTFAQKSLPARISNRYAPTQVPVVSLYTSKDELVRTYHADSIRGARTLKARIDEAQPSHCGFSEAEVAAGWQALTQTIAGAPVPQSPSAQAQALLTLCGQAQALGAAGGCRIVSSSAPAEGKPRARKADDANVATNTSGLYYDPSRSGEGVLLEVMPDNTALAAWFTFPQPGDGGAQQKWIIGSGTWAGNGASITPVIAGFGTQFGAGFNPSQITRLPWGALAIALDAPNGQARMNGRMRYQGPVDFGGPDPTGGAGEVAFNQIATFLHPDNIEFSPPLPTEQQFLGTFWNPARSGEGLMLTQDQFTQQAGVLAPRVYALWFTYDLTGGPMWLFGDVTGKDGNYQITFLRPVGTHFGAAFNPAEVVRQPWGTATTSYSDCNHLTVNYNATQPGFGSGTLSLTRLTAPIGAGGCGP